MCLFNKKTEKSYEIAQKKFNRFEIRLAKKAVRLAKNIAKNARLQKMRCPKLVCVYQTQEQVFEPAQIMPLPLAIQMPLSLPVI